MYGDANMRKENLKNLLENEFVMNDLGAEKKIAGMEIRMNRRVEWLYISHIIKKFLRTFMCDQSKLVGTSFVF